MTKVVKVKYEKGVLRPLEPVDLREGEKVIIRLKDIINILRESSEKLERYLEEAQAQ